MANEQHITFIISGIVPYKYDVVQVLALPSGLPYRTRWRNLWVEPELRANPTKAIGRRALIVLRDHDTGRLFPIRWASIVAAERIGFVFYFEYHLGEYVFYPQAEQAAGGVADTFTVEINKHRGSFATVSDQTVMVFPSGVPPQSTATKDDTELGIWGNLVTFISTLPTFEGTEFLKIVSIAEFSGREAQVINGRVELSSNTLYGVKLFQLVPTPAPAEPVPRPHDLVLSGPPDHVKILRARQTAVGKYDILNFALHTLPVSNTEPSFLDIERLPVDAASERLPTLHVPTSIVSRTTLFSVLKFVAAALCVLLIIAPGVVGFADEEITRGVAIVLFTLLVSDRTEWGASILARMKFK